MRNHGQCERFKRVTIVQPAVPIYRVSLFCRMADRLGPGFGVYASRPEELGILVGGHHRPSWQHDLGPMRVVASCLEWQTGALSVPISKGDVLVVCGAPRTLSTLVLILKGKLKGASTIWWGHYWSATTKPWRASFRFLLMRLPNAIIFYTDQEVAEYRAHSGDRLSKPVYGLNNGIETLEIKRLRVPYIPAERPGDLLFIGRITDKAEIGLLLDALARPECSKITLDVIGDGPKRAELEKRATELGLRDRIAWHGATIDEMRIAEIANRCKAFVYPGSVGLSLIHGLAYGLPAIAHEDRWLHMPEFAALEPGKNGVTFRKGDASSLAKTIMELFADETTLRRLSLAAVTTTNYSFNTADMAERFLRAIEVHKSTS